MVNRDNYIANDVSRCNNYKCEIGAFCARFRQIRIDKAKAVDATTVSITTFNKENSGFCYHFINVEASKLNGNSGYTPKQTENN